MIIHLLLYFEELMDTHYYDQHSSSTGHIVIRIDGTPSLQDPSLIYASFLASCVGSFAVNAKLLGGDNVKFSDLRTNFCFAPFGKNSKWRKFGCINGVIYDLI